MFRKDDKWLWGIGAAVVALAAYRLHQAHMACVGGVLVQTWSWPFYACEGGVTPSVQGTPPFVNAGLPSAQQAR